MTAFQALTHPRARELSSSSLSNCRPPPRLDPASGAHSRDRHINTHATKVCWTALLGQGYRRGLREAAHHRCRIGQETLVETHKQISTALISNEEDSGSNKRLDHTTCVHKRSSAGRLNSSQETTL